MTTELILPKFNMDMDTAVLVRWLVNDGDRVAEGDPVAEVETDKVNMDVEATTGGILCALRFAPGDVVPVTAAIASIAPDEAAAAEARAAAAASRPGSERKPADAAEEAPAAGSSDQHAADGEPSRVRATPSGPT